jgi:hypothetical protein
VSGVVVDLAEWRGVRKCEQRASVQKKAGGYTERSAEYLMQSVEKK